CHRSGSVRHQSAPAATDEHRFPSRRVGPTDSVHRQDTLSGGFGLGHQRRFWKMAHENARWTRDIGRNPILAALVLLTAGWNLIGWMPEGPLAYYVTEEVGASATAYSWILATTSIGSLVGASLAPLTRTSKARMLVLVTGTPIYGAAF